MGLALHVGYHRHEFALGDVAQSLALLAAAVQAHVAALGGAEGVGDKDVGEMLLEGLLLTAGEHRAPGSHAEHRAQFPTTGIGLQGIQQGYRHGVADDGEGVHFFALDDIPHLLPHQGVSRVEHHRIARQQHDAGIPPAGAVHEGRQRHADDNEVTHPVGDLLRFADGPIRVKPATATHGGEEHVLVGPHDALGHAGRATGVENEQVVVGAGAEIPRGVLAGQRAFQLHRVDGRRVTAAVVRHVDIGFECRRLGAYRGDMGAELLVVDTGHHVGVGKDVQQFLLHVAVVDIDGHSAQLEAGQHGLQVLVAVVQVKAHVVAGAHTLPGEIVGQLVGAALKFCVSDAPVATHQGDPLGYLVRHQLEHVGDIEMLAHRLFLQSQGLSAPTTHMAKNWAPPP